jgi:hypothetical protein
MCRRIRSSLGHPPTAAPSASKWTLHSSLPRLPGTYSRTETVGVMELHRPPNRLTLTGRLLTPNPSPPRATPLPTLSFLSPTPRCRPGELQVTAVHLFTAPPPRRLSVVGKEQNGTPVSSSSFSPPHSKPLVVVALAHRSLVTPAASPVHASTMDQRLLWSTGRKPSSYIFPIQK